MNTIQLILLVLILVAVVYLITKTTPAKSKISHTSGGRAILLDSSALIDGRVVDVAASGFLTGTLVVPSSVLREMQYLADNGDAEKRSRARNGLDVVKQLQEPAAVTVQILDDGLPGDGGVDERLVTLSKQQHADLLTLDFNLNKVAQVEGVTVLNINQLAQNLRMSYLPGEKRSLSLVQKGQDSHQAVGYLEDGTMVVVEQASGQIGQSVEVEFTRALQTQAGKMLFAKRVDAHTNSQKTHSKSSSNKKYTKPINHHKNQTRSSKKSSPEDSLVDLANKQ